MTVVLIHVEGISIKSVKCMTTLAWALRMILSYLICTGCI